MASSSSSSNGSFLSRHPPVIIEIGSILLKAGFVGEVQPRIITHSPPILGAVLNNNYFRSSSKNQPSLPLNGSATASNSRYLPRYQRLVDELAVCVSTLYTRGLYIRPQDHTVLIIDNYLQFSPEFRTVLLYVLFHIIKIPHVKFIAQPLSVTLGINHHSSLIIDVGNTSTRIIPVVLGQILHNNIQICSNSGNIYVQHYLSYIIMLQLANRIWTSYYRNHDASSSNLEIPKVPTLSSNVLPRPGVTYNSIGYDYPVYNHNTYTKEGLEIWNDNDTSSFFLHTHDGDIEGLFGRWIENLIINYSKYLFPSNTENSVNDENNTVSVNVPSSICRLLRLQTAKNTDPSFTEYSFTTTTSVWSGIGELLWSRNTNMETVVQQYEVNFMKEIQASSNTTVQNIGGFIEQCVHDLPLSSYQQTFFNLLKRVNISVHTLVLQSVEEETQSVPHCIVNAIRTAPIDTRKILASSVCITGGIITSNMEAYSTLLGREIYSLVTGSDAEYQGIDKVNGKFVLDKTVPSTSSRFSSKYSTVRPLLSYLTISNYTNKYSEPVHISWFGTSLLGYTLSVSSRLIHGNGNTVSGTDFQRTDALTESSISREKFMQLTTMNSTETIDIPLQYNFSLFASGILAWDYVPTITDRTKDNVNTNGKNRTKTKTSSTITKAPQTSGTRSTSVSSTSSIEILTRTTSSSSVRTENNNNAAKIISSRNTATVSPPILPTTTTKAIATNSSNAAKLELLSSKLKTVTSKPGSTTGTGTANKSGNGTTGGK